MELSHLNFDALSHKIPQQTDTIGALACRASEDMIKYLEDGAGLLVEPKQK